MNYNIEPIRSKHFPALISLFKEFAEFEKLPDKMVNSIEQMEMEKDYITGFVVLDNNQIIAYVTCFYAYYTWIGKSLYMDDLYVTPNYRGKGLGTILINKVIEKAKTEQCRKLRWQVSSWNKPAIDFYKSLGANIDDVEINCDLPL